MRYKSCRSGGKRMRLHVAVWLAASGLSAVPTGYCVHHANGNRLDNRTENLVLMAVSDHAKMHAASRSRDRSGRFVGESN